MNEPFYKDGLNFSCTRCNNCCRHEPGYVFLSQKDLNRLADGLSLSADDFIHRYCRTVDMFGFKRLSLTEKPNYDCVFWADGGCTVYNLRPLQCRSYPFWSSHLVSRHAWNSVEESCPGVNYGQLHSRAEIDQWLQKRLDEPLITL